MLVGREARGDDLPGLPRFVDGDEAVARAGERAGAVDDLLQDGVEVEARADAQDGGAEGGDALPQRLVLPLQVVGLRKRALPPDRSVSRPAGTVESRNIPPFAASGCTVSPFTRTARSLSNRHQRVAIHTNIIHQTD